MYINDFWFRNDEDRCLGRLADRRSSGADWLGRGLWAVFGGLFLLALAACDEAPSSNTRYMHPSGTWDFLVYATQSGPLLIDIEGQALPGSNAEFEGAVIAIMNEAQHKRIVRFTRDRSVAPTPDFRVVVAFNGGAGLDSQALCSGQARGGGPSSDRIETLATFCRGGEVLSAVHGWTGRSEAAEKEHFKVLMEQVTRDLFAPAPPDR